MKGPLTLVFAAFLAIAAHAQTTTPPGSGVDSSSPLVIALDPAPTSVAVRIRTPVADEKFIHTNSVKVRFDVIGPVSSGTPNFLVQLDGDEPVRTSNMEQTFSDLAPGTHSVSVQLVGDNSAPYSASRADVEFEIAPHRVKTSHRDATLVSAETEAHNAEPAEALSVTPEQNAVQQPPQLSQIAVQQSPPAEIMSISSPLPSAGSALPLISVIGFGVLVGGIASAMKTR
jgi:hypothetical protein